MPFSRNSRHWESFGSRTSENMNIPFVYMCLKSIIDNCGDKHDVIIYDDTNVVDILQEDLNLTILINYLVFFLINSEK